MADPKTHDPAQDAEGESEGRYRHTREAFHELPLEKQARFLVEATASTMARGLEAVARSVADEMEAAFRSTEPTDADASGDHDDASAHTSADATSSDAGPAEEPDATAGDQSDPDDTSDAPDDPIIT